MKTDLTTKISVRKGKNKNILIELQGKTLGNQLQSIESPYSIYVPGLAGIQNEEEIKSVAHVRRAAARGYANNVFRNIILLLKKSENWDQFINDFHTIFPNFHVDVTYNGDTDEYINATIIMDSGINLPIDAAGTGVLQIIQILAYINLYDPKVLLLDEPDAHLHSNNQRILARLLTHLAESRNIQIIMCTHSRSLLDELSEKAKIIWIRNGVLVEGADINAVNVLMELGALDKGDKLRQGAVKCVILSEDDNIKLLSKILESSGFIENQYEIWSYKGCTKRDTAVALSDFIQSHAPGTKVIVHIDRDYNSDDEITEIKRNIEKNANIKCFVTKGTDIESHCLSAQHINILNPEINLERAQELINIATESATQESLEKFINSRTTIEKRNGNAANINPGRIAAETNTSYNSNK